MFNRSRVVSSNFSLVIVAGIFFLYGAVKPLHAQVKQEKKDSIAYHSILIIPYDPRYYLSDADREISAASKENPESFRKRIRVEADRNIYRTFARQSTCISVLLDTSQALFEDVAKVMSKTGYQYDTPTIKEKVSIKDHIIKTDPNKDAYDSRTSSQYLNEKTELRYMKAVITQPELLTEMAAKHHIDLVVFVTQMEIKTNYSSCMDIANQVYKREVMLHFTVYDKSANLIAGNFAKTFFPSNQNNVNTIIGQCFPQLAQGILNSIEF